MTRNTDEAIKVLTDAGVSRKLLGEVKTTLKFKGVKRLPRTVTKKIIDALNTDGGAVVQFTGRNAKKPFFVTPLSSFKSKQKKMRKHVFKNPIRRGGKKSK